MLMRCVAAEVPHVSAWRWVLMWDSTWKRCSGLEGWAARAGQEHGIHQYSFSYWLETVLILVAGFFSALMAAHDFHVNSMVSRDTAAGLFEMRGAFAESLFISVATLFIVTEKLMQRSYRLALADLQVRWSAWSSVKGSSRRLFLQSSSAPLTKTNLSVNLSLYQYIPKSAFFFPPTLILSDASINLSLKVVRFEQLCLHFAQNGKKILCCAMQTIRFNGLPIAAVLLSP